MKIDVIIPNYNGAHLIEKNLPFVLLSIKKLDAGIIIVDDGSKEEDVQNLRRIIDKAKESFKNIKLVEHKKNKGFSSAINTGVKQSNAEFIVLLNSDVLPNENFLHSPIGKLDNDKMIFGIGCLDESIEGEKKVLRGAGFGRWEKGMVLHSEGDINLDKTFWISGGSSIIRRNSYNELEGLDEIYNPFYWEDIDLSYRAQKANYKILFDKDSVVRHYHDEGSIKTNFNKKHVSKIAYRNQFIFVWKNISDKKLMLDHIINLPINIIGALKRGDLEFINGLFLAILKLPVIIKKRNSQFRTYKIPDKTILGLTN